MKRPLHCLLALSLFCGCAAPRPVLYPNELYQSAGKDQVKADIDECDAKAKEFVKANKGKLVAKRTGIGAAFGAFLGMILGAFSGNYRRAVAEGAAVGAAAGLAHGAAEANSPDEVHKRFVELCLSQKGYQPIGWK